MRKTNLEESHSERTILHTLKTEFLKMKCSNVSQSASAIKKKSGAKHYDMSCHHQHQRRLGMRRGSSMSDLEKLTQEPLPDLVRSTTTNYQLSVSPAGTLPHSPNLSRSFLSSNTTSVRGQLLCGCFEFMILSFSSTFNFVLESRHMYTHYIFVEIFNRPLYTITVIIFVLFTTFKMYFTNEIASFSR